MPSWTVGEGQKQLILLYHNVPSDGSVGTWETFQTVKCTDAVITTTEEQGTLLNGRKYKHLLYAHKELDVVISADEVSDAILGFLQSFWTANYRYEKHLLPNGTWSSQAEVLTSGGKFPLSYIDEVKALKEVAFTLSYVLPT